MPPLVTMPRWPLRTLAMLLLCTSGLVLFACTQPQSARPILSETPTPLIAGQTLVTPIDRAGAMWDGRAMGEPPDLVFSDGSRAPTSIAMVARRSGADPHSWLPSRGAWMRVEDADEDADEAASAMLLAPIPDTALGQSVWMEGRRVPAYWIVPGFTPPPPPQRPQRVLDEPTPAQRAAALALAAPDLDSPLLRWRAVLALERLGVEAPPIDAGLTHDWADQWANQWANQWAVRADAALARLHAADAMVCERLLDTLTRWLVTPTIRDGLLPVWPTDEDALADLLLALLRPGATDEAVSRTAQAYVDRQPQWLAWVMDDAGGVVGGSIAVVNLGHAPALLSAREPQGVWQAIDMVDPGQMVVIPAPAAREGVSQATAYWEVRLGGRTALLPITTGAIDLMPPGVAIGPFWHDWTLEGLVAGSGRSPSPGSIGWIGGLVHPEPRMDLPASSGSGWVVYIEVRRPPCGLREPGGRPRPLDAVRLAFGPSDRPRAEVTVRCTGLTSYETLPIGAAPGEGALLNTLDDRWVFTLPIDARWLEPDGTILLGVQSLPADGPRATWPRPVLPGQIASGRVRIDPASWGLPRQNEELSATRPTAR